MQPAVEFDAALIGWLNVYRSAEEKIRELDEVKLKAREQLEQALGDCETGTVAGRPAVRWSFVKSQRFDQSQFRESHPDLYERFRVPLMSRRFTVVDGDSA